MAEVNLWTEGSQFSDLRCRNACPAPAEDTQQQYIWKM